jgi:deoxyxylulose-5-phosphate synthase
VGALSSIYHDTERSKQMPVKKFIEDFAFDPSTFNYDTFKAKLLEEATSDDDLAAAKITELTESNTNLSKSERDLKVRLFDATVAKQGEPVAPTDSPAAGGGPTGPAPAVPDSDIFG